MKKKPVQNSNFLPDIFQVSEADHNLVNWLTFDCPEAMISVGKNSTIVFINQTALKLFGYRAEELLGKDLSILIPQNSKEKHKLLLKDFVGSNRPTIESKHRPYLSASHKSGRIFSVAISLSKLTVGDEEFHTATIRDVTSLISFDDLLNKNTNVYKAMIETTDDVVVIIDLTGKILYHNPAIYRLLGYNNQILIHKSISGFIHPNSSHIFEKLKQSRDSGTFPEEHVEISIRHQNGSEVPFDSSISFITGFDNKPAVMIIAHQILQRKNAEQTRKNQLRFSTALNKLSESIILSQSTHIPLSQIMVDVIGDTLQIERCVIFEVNKISGKVTSLSKWLKNGISDVTTSNEIYPVESFSESIEFMESTHDILGSHENERHPSLIKEGSDIFLHDTIRVKSLFWFPFHFSDHGFNILVFNELSQTRNLSPDEINFLHSASKLVEISVLNQKLVQLQKETLQEFESLVENNPDVIIFKDGDGRWLIINPVAKKLFKLENIDWKFKTDKELGNLNPQLKNVYDECIKTDKMAWQKKNLSESIEFFSDENEEDQVFVTRKIPLYETDGSRHGLVVIGRNITPELKSKEMIEEQGVILNNAQDAIGITDLNLKIIFWNKSAEKLYGFTEDEVLGKSLLQFVLPKTNLHHFSLNEDIVTLTKWKGEMTHFGKNGAEIIVESRQNLIYDNVGKPKSILFINTDITDKKKLERQFLRAQRADGIGTLANGIAHDFNNILAPILISVQLLKEKYPVAHDDRVISIIESNVIRGSELIKKLLMFTRGVEGKYEKLNPADQVKEISNIIFSTFPKNINLVTDVPADIWNVKGDTTQIYQVLLNLCVNARDAMPKGGTLTIELENVIFHEDYVFRVQSSPAGNYVAFRITDTGNGIPSDIIDKIFDPFFTTKELDKGTGLGLSTVSAIVKSHGGVVNVYSEPGKGTQFRIYIPALISDFTSKTEETPEKTALQGTGECILIVDDEEPIRHILKEVLHNYGYSVLEADSGISGIAMFSKHQNEIKAVISDVSMPSMDGIMMIRAIREINHKIKVIFMSGLPEKQQFESLTDIKYDAFLIKPYRSQKLLSVLKEILG